MQPTPAVESLRAPLCRRAMTVVVIALLLTVGGGSASARQNAPDQASILAAYNAAIYDSSVYKFSNLRPLRPLKFDPATRTASVVALTNFDYKPGDTTLPAEIYLWVTGVPEVQDRCRGFSGDVRLRLLQLLGLHPGRQVKHFVLMTVKEGDIVRPTAADDPTTTLPCSCPVPVNCGETLPATVSPNHLNWFARQMLSSYVLSESPLSPVGYPWTRLGYTYDWKPGADKYGASEYIVRPGATVKVTAVIPYQQYCSPTG
jgi:hypothetical protein